MKIEEYIADLRKTSNIVVSLHDGEIKIRGPKASLTDETIERIKSRRAEILAFFSNKHNGAIADSIPKAAVKEFYPISHAQRGLYSVYASDPNSIAYNMPAAFIIDGAFDIARCEGA